jgi:hypothetical protein
MHEESDHTYRLRPYFRNIGIVGTSFFLCAWGGSVLAAYFNADGSFARPVLAIVFFSVGWGSLTLVSVWLTLIYLKYRLFLSDDTVRHVGVLKTKTISLDTVQQLKWRVFPQGGSCVLTCTDTNIKIEFNNFSKAEKSHLITFLRQRVCGGCQENWDSFHNRFLVHSPERAWQQRSAKRILILGIFAFAAAFAVIWMSGGGVEYLVISVVNILVGAWAAFRKRRTQKAA